MPLKNRRHYCFVFNNRNSTRLLLPSTLPVAKSHSCTQQFYSTFNPPPLIIYFIEHPAPRQRGIINHHLFEIKEMLFSEL